MSMICAPRLDIKVIVFGRTVLSVLLWWSKALMIHDIKKIKHEPRKLQIFSLDPCWRWWGCYTLEDRCLKVQRRWGWLTELTWLDLTEWKFSMLRRRCFIRGATFISYVRIPWPGHQGRVINCQLETKKLKRAADVIHMRTHSFHFIYLVNRVISLIGLYFFPSKNEKKNVN